MVLLCSAVGALAWSVHRYAQTTPRFAIRDVHVEGAGRLVREDVLATADIKKGQNLFSLDVARAERALLRSPWISSARVTRRLPGTVRIQIAERQPRAIAVIFGKNFLVSQDGFPFKQLGEGDPHDLPLITGVSEAALGRDRRAEEERIAQTIALLREYESLPFARGLPPQEAHLSDNGSVSLVVGDKGSTLHLGQPPYRQKLLRAERVLAKTVRAGGKPSVVFLDNAAHPERVVVRVQ
jgi:cell division protein FtsQ